MITRPYQITAALLTSLLLLTAPAASAQQSYWVLKAIPSLKPVGGAGSGPVAPKVELAAGLLPDGMEGKPYSFDLKTLTQVTAGPGIGSVQYALAGGTLPAGVSLSNDGLLGGTPTTQTAPEGESFTVVGTYAATNGQQIYKIRVGESVLMATQIAAGPTHTCAITTTGAAKCWGENLNGQLGDGTRNLSDVPVQVSGLTSGVTSIAAGGTTWVGGHTCAVVNGAAKCWGYGANGRLGNGASSDSIVPVQVSGLTAGVTAIVTGTGSTCALVSGAVHCWGQDYFTTPGLVSGLASGVTALSLNGKIGCVIVSGAAKCWGFSWTGLGDGVNTVSSVPVQVLGLTSGVTAIAAGVDHACAVVSGSLKCWGTNWDGRLGNGQTTNSSVPVQVTGLTSGVTAITAGEGFVCAIHFGAGKCWGANYGSQLGDGTVNDSSVPQQVSGLNAGVSAMSAGSGHACAIVSGGAKCWGDSVLGSLGNGKDAYSPLPVTVKAGN